MTTTNIQPGELKIGNYVLAPKSDEYDLRLCKIFEIRKKFFRVIEISTNMMFDQTSVEPIELTEQWLLEFGFVKNDRHYSKDMYDDKFMAFYYPTEKYRDEYEYEVQLYGDAHCQITIDVFNVKGSAIRYVHQLQNLYFALTATPLSREKGKGESNG